MKELNLGGGAEDDCCVEPKDEPSSDGAVGVGASFDVEPINFVLCEELGEDDEISAAKALRGENLSGERIAEVVRDILDEAGWLNGAPNLLHLVVQACRACVEAAVSVTVMVMVGKHLGIDGGNGVQRQQNKRMNLRTHAKRVYEEDLSNERRR